MGRSNAKIWEGKNGVLCGGRLPAECCEHAPPTVIFREAHRPKGLEVPACKRCNTGDSQLDQLASFLALSQSPEAVAGARAMTPYDLKVVRGVANNVPKFHRTVKRALFSDGKRTNFQSVYEVELTRQAQMSVAKWCAKQAMAIWYVKTSSIVSHRAVINVDILTNAVQPSADLEAIIDQMGPLQTIGGGKMQKPEEFGYKVCIDGEGKEGLVFAHYHGGFAFIAAINDRRTARLSGRGFGFNFGTNAHKGIHLLP